MEQTNNIHPDLFSFDLGYKLAGQSGWNSKAEAMVFARDEHRLAKRPFDQEAKAKTSAGWNARRGKKR